MDIMKSRDFKEASGDFSNLVVIDFLNLCFRYKHAKKKIFAAEVISTIQSFGRSYYAKDIVIAGDWGSAWRKEKSPEYKANREELKNKQTEDEQNDFIEFLEEASRALEMLKDMYLVFRFKGVEADDIAAYIATRYSNNYEHTWLISTDRDWDLLITDKVSRFSYITRKEITMDNWSDHYDYSSGDHISVKVLQGDSGDNVAGVEGVGAKRAINLINEYGSAYDILASLPINSNYKYIKNLNLFGDRILLNYELMDLETYCDEAIGSEGCKEIDEVFKCT